MRFNGAKSKPLGRIMVHVTLGGKMINHEFHLMDCKSPYNIILGRDQTTRKGAVVATQYQCLKFPLKDKVIKVWSNQWLTHNYNEKSFDGIELRDVEDMEMIAFL